MRTTECDNVDLFCSPSILISYEVTIPKSLFYKSGCGRSETHAIKTSLALLSYRVFLAFGVNASHSAYISPLVDYRLAKRHRATMAATTTDSGGDDSLQHKTQQSPLASQRAKASNTPSEENRKARFSGYFPLSYKEGFSQWASKLCRPLRSLLTSII